MTNKEAIEKLRTRYLTMSQCLNKEELNRANAALDKAIEIPNNPTNGDMFKAVFSAKEIGIDEWYQNIGVSMNDGYKRYFSLDWWNAPYKAESEE